MDSTLRQRNINLEKEKKPTKKYFFNGLQVCKHTFCFAHGIQSKKLQAIATFFDKDALVPWIHKNTKWQPKHSLTYDYRERIKTFICKNAIDNALPLPGCLPNFKESRALLLPSDKNVNDNHNEYEMTAKEMQFRIVHC